MKSDGDKIFYGFDWIPYQRSYDHSERIIKLREQNLDNLDNYKSYLGDLTPPPSDIFSKNIGDKIEKLWAAEVKRCGTNRKPNLFIVIIKTMIKDLLKLILLNLIIRVICCLTILELIDATFASLEKLTSSKLVYASYLNGSSANQTANSTGSSNQSELYPVNYAELEILQANITDVYRQVLLRVFLIIVPLVAQSFVYARVKMYRQRCGLLCRTGLCQLISRKSARLRLTTSIEQSSSTAINLVANDVTIVEESNNFFAFSLFGPIVLLIGTSWLAFRQTGWLPILASYVLVALTILFLFYEAEKYKILITNRKQETLKRVEVTNNFLNSIKVAKMYNWEIVFRKLIDRVRNKELYWLERLDRSRVTDTVACFMMTKLIPTIVYLVYIMLYGNISASILYTVAMGYTAFTMDGVFMYMRGRKTAIDMKSSCVKIENYLLLEERNINDRKIHPATTTMNTRTKITCKGLTVGYGQEEPEVESSRSIKNIELSQKALEGKQVDGFKQSFFKKSNHKSEIIDSLDVEMLKTDLVIVVGQVGSGKSSLLLALLKEIQPTSGSLIIDKLVKISYASQEPLIMADSVKNNILFGRKLDVERYKRVIEVCSLERDIRLLPNGDETLVGTRGVSLSGGQKARINLARCVYTQADVYLLDDPLSAVDSRVSEHIFESCIRGLLSSKLVVLATHQRQFIRRASKVIVLERGAKPIVGSPSELLDNKCPQLMMAARDEEVREEPSRGVKLSETNEKLQQKLSLKKMDSSEVELDLATIPTNLIQLDLANSQRSRADNFRAGRRQIQSPYALILKFGLTQISAGFLVVTILTSTPLNGFVDYYLKLWRQKITDDLAEPTVSDSQFAEHLFLGCALYACLAIINGLFSMGYQYQIFTCLRRSSQKLHNKLMDSLFEARMSFFDFCSTGTLGTRYASDFTQIDHVMPQIISVFCTCSSWLIGFCIMVCLVLPIGAALFVILFAACAPSVISGYRKSRILVETSRMLRAPTYTNLSAIVDDLNTIRSDPDYIRFALDKFDQSQDRHTSVSLLTVHYEARISTLLRMPLIPVLALAFYLKFVLDSDNLDVPTVGVFLMLISNITGIFPFVIELLGSIESAMASVNSIQQLLDIVPEEERRISGPTKLAGGKQQLQLMSFAEAEKPAIKREWQTGRIEFKELSLRYFTDEKPVLNRISFVIEGGTRVGVVGRTGAGKSTIVSVLFRLYPYEGSITIDGVDIAENLSMSELRSSLGVIPQDPVLFSDSLRKNLDPFNEYSDEQIWRALEVVKLRQHVADNLYSGLDYHISEGGRNFSVGQRQLVCLARAILKSPRILVMDEATANVDPETDLLIQQTIKVHFNKATVITIAHRLNTVLDYDKILVLDAGQIVEYDRVEALLAKEDGHFKRMLASASGIKRTSGGL